MNNESNMDHMENLRDNYKGVFDHQLGLGQKPALIIVDFVNAYTTPGKPLYAPQVVEAVEATKDLLHQFHMRKLPVIFTRVVYEPNGLDGGLFVKKIPVLREMTETADDGQIVAELPMGAGDILIRKQYASAFFGTNLASTLNALRVDSIILTGCSTSGCIRATAVDGMQHGLRVIVPKECVGDRAIEPHEANLFDIDSKYGDVLSRAEVFNQMENLP